MFMTHKKDDHHTPALPSLKGVFPFRLGTTSFILPDDYVPNVAFLGPLVDDVELLLFESDEISHLPKADVIDQLAALKQTERLTYTVHLPLDIHLGSSDEAVRKRSVEKCLKVIDITGSLGPFAYIIHFHGEKRGKKPVEDMDQWRESLDRSAHDLMLSGIEPDLLCVETLDYPFEYVADIVSRHGLSVCLDIGHLAFHGYPIRAYLDRYLDRCRVIHLHGNVDGVDHRDIGILDAQIPVMLTGRLGSKKDRERVLTLEVFGRGEFEKSMGVMRRLAG